MYEVKELVLDGLTIAGFVLENENSEIKNIRYTDFIALVKSGNIQGVRYVDVDGEKNLVGLDISQIGIRKDTKISIVSHIQDEDGNIVGYETDNGRKLSSKKIWDMAVNNRINNCRALFTQDGTKIIKYIRIGDTKNDIQVQEI